MERNKQVDIIRGVAILLVVLEHALGTSDNFFAKIILSFHMPVFFILSGYLAHEKITGNFGAVIKKKIKRLLIPQLTLAILSLLYNFFIGKLVLHTATAEELSIFYCFFRWWFLFVMAQVVIAWEVLTRICKNYLIEAEGILAWCLYNLYHCCSTGSVWPIIYCCDSSCIWVLSCRELDT